jgi:hypothetical protein
MRKRVVALGILLVVASLFAGTLPLVTVVAQSPCTVGANATVIDCPAPSDTPGFCMQRCLTLCGLTGARACGKVCSAVCH